MISSCGGGGNTASLNNGTKIQAANLTLNSSSLDFGNVNVGSSKTSSIMLTNSASSGGPNVVVSQAAVAGSGFTMSAPPMPLTLAAGQSATVSITFSPKSAGSVTGTLSITVENASGPISVPLTGNGLGPGQLDASPSSMNFGTITVGSSHGQTGTLTAGSADILVNSASWNGQGYTLSGITFPTTVKASTSTSFMVTFAPQVSGRSSGQVSFLSNASNSPAIVTFSGTGAQPTQHTVTLSWNASTSPVVGYYIYRSTQSGSYSTPLNTSAQPGLTYTDATVQSGTTYYYVVTSVDSSFQQSVYSNEVPAIVP